MRNCLVQKNLEQVLIKSEERENDRIDRESEREQDRQERREEREAAHKLELEKFKIMMDVFQKK